MRIGELAAQTGMSRDTIRFYEKVGLIAGRRLANGYRDFPPEAVAWLHYVRTAQTLGFSLAEIARTGEELRGAPDAAEALSTLFEERSSSSTHAWPNSPPCAPNLPSASAPDARCG